MPARPPAALPRRQALVAAAALLGAGTAARAGVMDWFNGVRLDAELPDFDAEYPGPPPPPADSRLLLIDFWATWCAPCRAEFPHLNALHARFATEGLGVLGLSQEPLAVVRDFLPKAGIAYPVGAGGTRPLQAQLGVRALPYAVLVNRQRRIVWRGQASSLPAAELAQRLKAAG